ncbi:MAG: hypothetical protein SAK29_39565 [Scytonema sp. PMC 1069.18]|nr:hypothetical protein [Scytonema sp. PMC 1069.18]MEC4887310.1 hypothetical protein [Scytonema sp. PMC 1070.18]
MQHKCVKNRKRSKRRAIACPVHGCYLDSASPKKYLFADRPGQLQARGMSRKTASMLIAERTTVSLTQEWLEAFWCRECEQTQWYHVRKFEPTGKGVKESCRYEVRLAPQELWKQVSGVIHPEGNPSVGEFTLRHARQNTYRRVWE